MQNPEDNGQPTRRSPRKHPNAKRALNTEEEEDPIIISPTPAQRAPLKKRGATKNAGIKSIAQQTDEEVWDFDDEDIIAAALKTWTATAYDHFTTSLKRDEKAKTITFVFTCKTDNAHEPHTRLRMKTGSGTSNLNSGVKRCEERNIKGVKQQTLHRAIDKYDPKVHRVLVALRCAQSHRPFNSVEDDLYKQEVEMLRPGTVVPHRTTVSRDVKKIHDFAAKAVKEYFGSTSCIHVVLDGWSNPQYVSFLGIVFIWYREHNSDGEGPARKKQRRA